MTMSTIALTLFSFIPLLLTLFFYFFGRRCHSFPSTYPIIGNLIPLLLNRHRFHDWVADLLTRAPTFTVLVRTPFSTPGICTANPAVVDHLLRSNFPNYVKGDRFRSHLSDLLGAGIFAVDGRLWSQQRKTASHEFSTRSLRSFVAGVVRDEVAARLLPILRSAAVDGRILDLDDLFCRFAFDNICTVAFGADPACLAAGDPLAFFRDFDTATEICFGRLLSPFPWVWRAKRLLDVGSERQLRQAVANINKYAMDIIASREQDGDGGGHHSHTNPKKLDLLSRFGDAYDKFEEEDQESCDLDDGEHRRRRKREFLRDIVISFILAGKDTTSTALTWLFRLLTANPDSVRRIRLEIAETAAAAGMAADEDGDLVLGYEELKGMSFLHAAVSESLRLHPPVPINTRLAGADDVLPDGTLVRAGWFVAYSAYAMARMEGVWGPDCREFSPERWLNKRGEFVAAEPAKFPVFHAGPRACLGREMAYLQMKAVVAAVVQGFEVEREAVAGAGEETATAAYAMSLTLKMKGGFPVRIRRCRND